MAEIQEIAPGLMVGPQVWPADLEELRARGIRALVCNRPDGEEPGQPAFADIAEAARAYDIDVRYVPVRHGADLAGLIPDFAEALRELPRPLLAYCRSGARSAALVRALDAG